MKRVRRWFRIALVAVLLAACVPLAQAYSRRNAPPTTGFVAEANAACTRAANATRALPKITSVNLPLTLHHLTTVFGELNADLTGVQAPRDKRAAYRAYLTLIADQDAQLHVAANTLGPTGRPVGAGQAIDRFYADTARSESIAARLHLSACAQGYDTRR